MPNIILLGCLFYAKVLPTPNWVIIKIKGRECAMESVLILKRYGHIMEI